MDIFAIRTTRLKELVAHSFANNFADFCRKSGEDASYISRVLKGTKPFSELIARRVEKNLGLEPCWLDRQDNPSAREERAPYNEPQNNAAAPALPEFAELFVRLSHHSKSEVMGDIVKRLYQEQGGIPKGVDPLAGTGAIAKKIVYGARDDRTGEERVSPQGGGHGTSPRAPAGGREKG